MPPAAIALISEPSITFQRNRCVDGRDRFEDGDGVERTGVFAAEFGRQREAKEAGLDQARDEAIGQPADALCFVGAGEYFAAQFFDDLQAGGECAGVHRRLPRVSSASCVCPRLRTGDSRGTNRVLAAASACAVSGEAGLGTTLAFGSLRGSNATTFEMGGELIGMLWAPGQPAGIGR